VKSKPGLKNHASRDKTEAQWQIGTTKEFRQVEKSLPIVGQSRAQAPFGVKDGQVRESGRRNFFFTGVFAMKSRATPQTSQTPAYYTIRIIELGTNQAILLRR
jgi:hypothetical protein